MVCVGRSDQKVLFKAKKSLPPLSQFAPVLRFYKEQGISNKGVVFKGVVFKVTPTGQETVLISFTGGTEWLSLRRLAPRFGGKPLRHHERWRRFRLGSIFKLDRTGKEAELYRSTDGTDGSGSMAGLIQDSAGKDSANNFYGTTQFGRKFGAGVVFKLAP
jgi:hypothetical protein